MPEDLWVEFHGIVQEVVIKTIPMKKKCKKENGCLTRPYKKLRGEKLNKKGEGGKDSYTHLNAEYPKKKKTRRNKAFLSHQCQEIE